MTLTTLTRAAGAGRVRPILKWAGGKRQLLPTLRRYYPDAFARYVEPFLGSGAVFLDCHNSGLLDGREVRLSDINADVIGCYRMVRDDVEAVIEALERPRGRAINAAARGTSTRSATRGSTRCGGTIHASADPARAYTPALAAMLIYLNRTGYNGLFRLNSRGGFNVPAGRYNKVTICDAPNLRRLSSALRRPGLTVEVRRFDDALADGRPDDFVYLDPPYAPVSSYGAFHVLYRRQIRPRGTVAAAAGRGQARRTRRPVLLSNSVAPDIRRLYAVNGDAKAVGLKAQTVAARRAINSRASQRGAVREYLITNIV